MSDQDNNPVYIDPFAVEETLQQLALLYDLDADTLLYLRRVIELYGRPVTMYVDDANAPFYNQTPLVDRFTFNMQTDELLLFSRDPMTFVDALIEMAMYMAGFTTMMGVEEQWKIEFTIGAWKPVKNRIKRSLDIPFIDEPVWIVGLPPAPEEAPLIDAHPFRRLVAQLDIASFTQMVRLAGRDDVEVNFPVGADPRVIEVYIRIRTAMEQVADGILLDDWREFNHRLLRMVQELEEVYRPEALPFPTWWQQAHELDGPGARDDLPGGRSSDQTLPAALDRDKRDGAWDPFEAYIEELFEDEE